MADIMKDVENSIGKHEESKETKKMNGDACDNLNYQNKRESFVSSKHIINIDKPPLPTIDEKLPKTLANGHIENDHPLSEDCQEKSATFENIPDVDHASLPHTVPEVDRSPTCTNTETNDKHLSDDTDSSVETEIRAKETKIDSRIPKAGSVVGDTFKTQGGLSITVVSGNSDPIAEQNGEGDHVQNSENHSDSKDDDVISMDNTPEKGKKSKKSSQSVTITPRRSSRNLNKQTNYVIDDKDDIIEEVAMKDPLADDSRSKSRDNTIVVSDTRGLVEYASNARSSNSFKKESTLVIIDTKSILSGRGPVPLSHSSNAVPISLSAARGLPASTSAFSVIPIGLPAQGMYSQYKNPPPQMKPIIIGPPSTTVTPVTAPPPIASVSTTTVSTTTAPKQQQIILPSLSDDMFVVEAPSFIVPYVYEKPPMEALKEKIGRIRAEIEEAEEKEREERKKQETEEKDKEEREKAEKKKEQENEKDLEKETQDKGASNEKIDLDEAKDDSEKSVTKDEEKTESAAKDSTTPMEVDTEPSATSTSEVDSSKDSEEKKETSIASESKTAVEKDEMEKIVASATESKADAEKDEVAEKKSTPDEPKKPVTYFDNPLGKFFTTIGLNLVQEHVQTDLLRSQKRRRGKEGKKCPALVHATIEELTKTLEFSKENNDPFRLEVKKCEYCSFKTESLLVMAHHLETPHMQNGTYRCNFCPLQVRSPHVVLYHMETEHNVRSRLEKAPANNQCPNCPFEDNQKNKLTRHSVSCMKKYRPEKNQEAPLDWEPPAKIPRVTRNRPPPVNSNNVYQAAISGMKQGPQNSLLNKMMPNANTLKPNIMNANKRPVAVGTGAMNRFPYMNSQSSFQQRPGNMHGVPQGMMYRNAGSNSQASTMIPQGYQLSSSNAHLFQNQNSKQNNQAATKLMNQPSISITPVPRQTPSQQQTPGSGYNNKMSVGHVKAGQPPSGLSGKNSFVVCEVCDGYIKDLDQLRNHMQWSHKVKIHPKMIYNRPPLNCQKCQYRFFTDQGLERHLLGSHGLVTSSMQEAANKSKDGGRCPICGRVYQYKLLNHVARDHQMQLKPAHLSYKCTVCTATFGMYKQFENHVYSAHSMVAKRATDSKKPAFASALSTAAKNDALLKPLTLNDEITIIPQPMRSNKPANKSSANLNNKKMECIDGYCSRICVVQDFSTAQEFQTHLVLKHIKPFKIKVSRCGVRRVVCAPTRRKKRAVAVPPQLPAALSLPPPRPAPSPPSEEEKCAVEGLDLKLLQKKHNLKKIRIRLDNYRGLRTDYRYKVIFHEREKSVEKVTEIAMLMPEVKLRVESKNLFFHNARQEERESYRAAAHAAYKRARTVEVHDENVIPSSDFHDFLFKAAGVGNTLRNDLNDRHTGPKISYVISRATPSVSNGKTPEHGYANLSTKFQKTSNDLVMKVLQRGMAKKLAGLSASTSQNSTSTIGPTSFNRNYGKDSTVASFNDTSGRPVMRIIGGKLPHIPNSIREPSIRMVDDVPPDRPSSYQVNSSRIHSGRNEANGGNSPDIRTAQPEDVINLLSDSDNESDADKKDDEQVVLYDDDVEIVDVAVPVAVVANDPLQSDDSNTEEEFILPN